MNLNKPEFTTTDRKQKNISNIENIIQEYKMSG